MMATGFIGLGDMGAPRPSGPGTQGRDIISNMSKARFAAILTDASNYTFTDGIAFMVSALTAEANGGVR
jgi:hypothetical protein